MADEQTKREEDRINRTLNNIGKRSARPMSWNVTAPPANLHGVGSIGRNTNATAIKTIQEQIREEERKQQALNAQQAHASAQQATYAPHHTDSSFGGDHVEDESEKDRKLRLEEDRLERWMKKGDSRFEENKVNPRNRSISVDSAADHLAAASTAFSNTKLTDLAVKFQDHVYQASKALRNKKSEDVVKHSFNAAITAKAIAETQSDDTEILGYARALEAGVNTMRTNVDSGGDGLQFYSELAGYLGQLFISTIGTI